MWLVGVLGDGEEGRGREAVPWCPVRVMSGLGRVSREGWGRASSADGPFVASVSRRSPNTAQKRYSCCPEAITHCVARRDMSGELGPPWRLLKLTNVFGKLRAVKNEGPHVISAQHAGIVLFCRRCPLPELLLGGRYGIVTSLAIALRRLTRVEPRSV